MATKLGDRDTVTVRVGRDLIEQIWKIADNEERSVRVVTDRLIREALKARNAT